MKRIFFILSLIGLLLQTFDGFILYTSYLINKKEIAKTLCVKKEIKNNTCKGKCHLKKKIKEAEKEKEESIPFGSSEFKVDVLLFSQHSSVADRLFYLTDNDKIKFFYLDSFSLQNVEVLDHPPKV